jgi:hypothetical protein
LDRAARAWRRLGIAFERASVFRVRTACLNDAPATTVDMLDGNFDGHGLISVAADLALALLLNQILAWHFVRCARTFSNRRRFARMFVLVGPTTLMILAAVQSSLALSLGLVGALSIIRFRTPIKDPEELAYLFISIATGVGLGAGQRLLTVASFVAVLTYAWLRGRSGGAVPPARSVVQVTAPLRDEPSASSGNDELQALLGAAQAVCAEVDLRRVDRSDGEFHCSLLVQLEGSAAAGALLERIRAALPRASVSIVEQDATS